jgi:hypothetical protein
MDRKRLKGKTRIRRTNPKMRRRTIVGAVATVIDRLRVILFTVFLFAVPHNVIFYHCVFVRCLACSESLTAATQITKNECGPK